MGYYVNPPTGTKEEWLAEHGEVVDPPVWSALHESKAFVVLIDNGHFTAAGICFSEAEFEAFKAPDLTTEQIERSLAKDKELGITSFSLDSGKQRPRTWYVVSKTDLHEVNPMVEFAGR